MNNSLSTIVESQFNVLPVLSVNISTYALTALIKESSALPHLVASNFFKIISSPTQLLSSCLIGIATEITTEFICSFLQSSTKEAPLAHLSSKLLKAIIKTTLIAISIGLSTYLGVFPSVAVASLYLMGLNQLISLPLFIMDYFTESKDSVIVTPKKKDNRVTAQANTEENRTIISTVSTDLSAIAQTSSQEEARKTVVITLLPQDHFYSESQNEKANQVLNKIVGSFTGSSNRLLQQISEARELLLADDANTDGGDTTDGDSVVLEDEPNYFSPYALTSSFSLEDLAHPLLANHLKLVQSGAPEKNNPSSFIEMLTTICKKVAEEGLTTVKISAHAIEHLSDEESIRSAIGALSKSVKNQYNLDLVYIR